MNERREPRFQVDKPVAVTVFGTPDLHLQCTIRNASGRGLGMQLAEPLAAGSALKINLEDAILLGEVIYCREQGGNWYAGVELEHALYGLAELAEAMRGFAGEPLGSQYPGAAQHAGRQHQ